MTAADLLADVVRELDALLTKIPDDRWDTPADNVGWSCRRTAEHVAGDFAHYAGQVVGQPENHYVKFSFDTSRAGTGLELAEVVSVAGGPPRRSRPYRQLGLAGVASSRVVQPERLRCHRCR